MTARIAGRQVLATHLLEIRHERAAAERPW
jgi:hypothetical protein